MVLVVKIISNINIHCVQHTSKEWDKGRQNSNVADMSKM